MTSEISPFTCLRARLPQSFLFLCLLLLGAAASAYAQQPAETVATAARISGERPNVLLGIDVLERTGFPGLQGKRVGLLTHPAGVNRRGISTVDVLRNSAKVRLVALFGPEHGIYGDEKANVPVDDRRDPRTGLPVFSLYGKTRKPTPKMLENLDVMVIDLQDLGARSYTYVSCMKLVMEACFAAGKEVMVLDRPNPLGGLKVDGPPIERQWMSYVGAYRVPYVHGMTIGELARMAKDNPGWLDLPEDLRLKGKLTVVPMQGWRRSMLWPDTGLRWVQTSPAVPNVAAAIGYPMTGLGGQLGGFSHGYGTKHPFRLLFFPGKSAQEIHRALVARNIPGLSYKLVADDSRAGEQKVGLYVQVTDWDRLRPTELSFHLMAIACAWNPRNPFSTATSSQQELFNKHVGVTEWMQELSNRGANARVNQFVEQWHLQALAFQKQAKRYWLYQP